MVEDVSGALGWRAADPREPLSCFWSAWPFPRLLENSNCDYCWMGRKTDQNAVWRRGIRCTEPACKPRPVPSISPGSEPCECSLRSPELNQFSFFFDFGWSLLETREAKLKWGGEIGAS